MMVCGLLAAPAITTAEQAGLLAADERLALKLQPAMRMYIRMGYTAVRPNDRSSDVRDLTGPVLRHGDEFTPGLSPQYAQALLLLSSNIQQDHPLDYRSQGLGAPRGVTVDAGGTGSPTVSVGAYLDEAQQWAIEAYVLGLPFKASVRGAGRIGGQGADAINLGEVMTTKQLGPIVFGKHIFGRKSDRFRLSLGLGAAYIAFFDTKASEAMARYAGGRTSVTLKNAFGPGIFMGGDYRLDDRWSLHANLGYLRLKTEGTIVTHADPAILSRSPVVIQAAQDVGPNTLTAIQIINGTTFSSPDLVPGIMEQLALARTGDASNIGTYVRKVDSRLDPWLLTLSVGYAF
jgi:outer membrane protein W